MGVSSPHTLVHTHAHSHPMRKYGSAQAGRPSSDTAPAWGLSAVTPRKEQLAGGREAPPGNGGPTVCRDRNCLSFPQLSLIPHLPKEQHEEGVHSFTRSPVHSLSSCEPVSDGIAGPTRRPGERQSEETVTTPDLAELPL